MPLALVLSTIHDQQSPLVLSKSNCVWSGREARGGWPGTLNRTDVVTSYQVVLLELREEGRSEQTVFPDQPTTDTSM